MERGMNKIVIITRRTRLEELIRKYNTKEQARFYIEHLGADFSDYLLEDTNYRNAFKTVKSIAEKYARIQCIDRDFIANMILGKEDIVIALGQDGLVANVMKYLDGQPLIGVNPDTQRWDGVLLPFVPEQLETILKKVLSGNYSVRQITMAKAQAKDGQELYAVNDLFIGVSNHTSARYSLTYQGTTENQSSSGIIISTGLGSTGWYSSIMAQAAGMAKMYGLGRLECPAMGWDSNRLNFVVREPYPSRFTQTGIVCGTITAGEEFTILSQMPENGIVFSDGIDYDNIIFNSGMEIKISIAERKGRLVI